MPPTRLTLASGRPVELTELRLTSTYGAMPEGYPCGPVNEMRIRGLLRAAEDAFPSAPVHLVPPSRTYPDQSPGGFGPVELLPAVACTGSFRSAPVGPGRDPALYRSSLTVVWFQGAPEAPSAARADPALRGLRWEELARDLEI
ncbi:hypothetical protein [Nocardiopsis potens]|uniref:hypothetical protein n=1 Tax=Nocardiopsis potens TaxID=1246458 RepID=UPI000344F723|nr:hypothetical protein [Nocardiopsis potens]